MPARSTLRFSALIACFCLTLQTPVPLAVGQGAPVGQSAPGRPICDGLSESANQLEAGLPVQNEWIRRTEEQLRAAEAGAVEPLESLRDIAYKSAQQLVLNQLKMVRGARAAITNARGYSRLSEAATQRRLAQLNEWVDRIVESGEQVENVVKVGKAGVAGADFGRLVNLNRATLSEFIKFVETSGISDDLGLQAAQLTGPAGVLVVESFIVARDLLYAGMQGVMTAREIEAARVNLASLRASRDAVESKVFGLRSESERCLRDQPSPPPTQDRMLVTPPPGAAPSTPSTPPAPAAAPPAQKDGGGSDAMLWLGAAAIAGGVGYYAYTKMCVAPTQNVLTVCSSQGGGSSACKSVIAEQDKYCKCEGYAGFNAQAGGCR